MEWFSIGRWLLLIFSYFIFYLSFILISMIYDKFRNLFQFLRYLLYDKHLFCILFSIWKRFLLCCKTGGWLFNIIDIRTEEFKNYSWNLLLNKIRYYFNQWTTPLDWIPILVNVIIFWLLIDYDLPFLFLSSFSAWIIHISALNAYYLQTKWFIENNVLK